MDEAAADGFTVTLVWAVADWPDGPPLEGGRPVAALGGRAPQQAVRSVTVGVRPGQTVQDLLDEHLGAAARARIAARGAHVAVYGRRLRPGMRLHPNDRIELLAPVHADVKAARARRVNAERAARDHDKWRGR